MSIQSTIDITREGAIDRITKVSVFFMTKNYKGLEDSSFEVDYDIEEFFNGGIYDIQNLKFWTDKMLKNVMDLPFFRLSMFDNYSIKEAK